MDTSVSIAIITSAASIGAGVLAFLSNRRTEKTREQAEATKGSVDVARLQIEQWNALLERYVVEVARVTAERDRYREELRKMESED